MDQTFDIVIRRARLRGHGDRLAEIGIKDGRIAAIGERLGGKGGTEIDAGGNLVTESFVNPHLHLCKVWTLPMMEEEALKSYQGETMGKAMAGIELASKIKEKYAESWIAENARRAVALAALHGNLHIRAFADVDQQGASRRRQGAYCGSATNSAALSICKSSRSPRTASCASRARSR